MISDNCKFVIGKSGSNIYNGEIPWTEHAKGDIQGIPNVSLESEAIADYNGYNNSELIRASDLEYYMGATNICYSYTITINSNIKNGYLASAGEWYTAYSNKSIIDNIINLIGGDTLLYKVFWTSTEVDSNRAWIFNWDNGALHSSSLKSDHYYICPFFPLNL